MPSHSSGCGLAALCFPWLPVCDDLSCLGNTALAWYLLLARTLADHRYCSHSFSLAATAAIWPGVVALVSTRNLTRALPSLNWPSTPSAPTQNRAGRGRSGWLQNVEQRTTWGTPAVTASRNAFSPRTEIG